MREESHLDDMRAAIRGDFERRERRRGTQQLMHVRGAEEEREPEPSLVLAAESVEIAQDLHVEVVEPEEPVEPLELAEPSELAEPTAPALAPRSWLARLLAAIPPRQV